MAYSTNNSHSEMAISIKVGIRCRPFVNDDKLGMKMHQTGDEDAVVELLNCDYTTTRFAFNYAWWSAHGYQRHLTGTNITDADDMFLSNQEVIYDNVGTKMKSDLMSGNAVVLITYGLSGSGKTYTVFGPEGVDDPNAWYKHQKPQMFWGIFPRLSYELFNEKQDGWKISMKYFQNIVDVIRDLLSPNAEEQHYKNGMRKDPDGFMDVEWCSTKVLPTWTDFLKEIQLANDRKAIAPTQFNPLSTRGHCILTLEVEMPHPDKEGVKQRGRIYVCDLNGTEPAGDIVYAQYDKITYEDGSNEYKYQRPDPDTRKTKELQEQSKKINLSLSELAQFFMKMAEAVSKKKLQPGMSIPGCNSFFLCKYLKDTLLQARTYLICAVRPEVQFLKYTFATLGLARNASTVSIAPKKTTVAVAAQERKLMDEMGATKALVAEIQARDGNKSGPDTQAMISELQSRIEKHPSNPTGTVSIDDKDEKQKKDDKVDKKQSKQGTDVNAAALARALEKGGKEWRRSKIMIVGEGRAGKTSFSHSITGKGFDGNLKSTVGINQLECTVTYAVRSVAGAWSSYDKGQYEFESALAEMIRNSDDLSNDSEEGLSMLDLMMEKSQIAAQEPIVANTIQKSAESKNVTPVKSKEPANSAAHGSTNAGINKVDTASAAARRKETSQTESKIAAKSSNVQNKAPTPKKVEQPIVSVENQVNDLALQTCLASNINNASNLIISVFDYGGQPVFNVIHHLFLTQNGVYVLVFNMEWLASPAHTAEHQKCLRFITFWINSIILHTSNNENNKAAPIALVGTRKDKIVDPAVHEHISLLLFDKFSDSNAWSSVIQNTTAVGTQGATTLCFFPIDNTKHLNDPSILSLMLCSENVMKENEFTTRMVPLSWLKAYDLMQESNEPCLSLEDVTIKCQSAGVAPSEVEYVLKFLHEMGIVLWHNEPTLRDVIILDAVQFFVKPATIIICKYSPDSTDATNHTMPEHNACRDHCKLEWAKFSKSAILSYNMLQYLWASCIKDRDVLVRLMIKFGLMVEYGNSTYLVPSLLTEVNPTNLKSRWTERPFLTCFFVFSTLDQLDYNGTIINQTDLRMYGFMPSGLFERFVAKAINWCQNTSNGVISDSMSLHKNVAIISFGRQRFRISVTDVNCMRVDIEGENPLIVHDRLLTLIRDVLDECMKSLKCFSAVYHNTGVGKDLQEELHSFSYGDCPEGFLLPIQNQMRVLANKRSPLYVGGRSLVSEDQFPVVFGPWLELNETRLSYDVFISYRWGVNDSNLSEMMFDLFRSRNVGEELRAIQVFLDNKRLKLGSNFLSDFSVALMNSKVIVPLVTFEALENMVKIHSESAIDNVLLEWILTIQCHRFSSVVCVLPIIVGRLTTEGLTVNVSDFFKDPNSLLKELPNVIPVATINKAREILQKHNFPQERLDEIQKWSVRVIVNEMTTFLGVKSWCDVNSYLNLPDYCVDKAVELLERSLTSKSSDVKSDVHRDAVQTHAESRTAFDDTPLSFEVWLDKVLEGCPQNQLVREIFDDVGIYSYETLIVSMEEDLSESSLVTKGVKKAIAKMLIKAILKLDSK